MKIMLFADMHMDNWGAYSTTLSTGLNSRFNSQLRILSALLHVAKLKDYTIVFAGDLFNRRLLVPTDVFDYTYELISKYNTQTIYLVVGNHDMYGSKPKHTILNAFSEMNHVNLITEVTNVYFQPEVDFTLVPYGEPIPAASNLAKRYRVLVAHYGIHEAKLGPANYRMESDLTVAKIKKYGYDLALFGHIHKPQALNSKVVVLGSAMAHSFHEVNEEKYFYVFDCKSRGILKHPTAAPKFLVHQVHSQDDLLNLSLDDYNYHRINIQTKEVTMADIRPIRDNAKHVVVSFIEGEHHVVAENEEKDKGRSPKDEIYDYFGTIETELDQEKLIKDALRIVEES